MKCVSCNNEVDGRNKFCSNCGNELKKEMFCTVCGEKLNVSSKFCSKCGTKLEKTDNKTMKFDLDSKEEFCMGAIIWMIVVIIVGFFAVVKNFSYELYIFGLLGLLMIIFYLLMLGTKNRHYFYGIIVIVTLIFLFNLAYNVNFFTAILGFLNPLITGILISIPKKK